MKIKTNQYLIIITLALVSGCSVLNYGHSKDEWNNLTEAEQINAKNEYQAIIDARNELDHDKMIEARDLQVIDIGVNPMGRRY